MLGSGSLRGHPPTGWPAALQFCFNWIGVLARDRAGMSAVEFGLAAPVLLAALSPVIDLGLAFSQQIQVQQAAAAGAQYVSLNYWTDANWQSNTISAVTSATTLPVCAGQSGCTPTTSAPIKDSCGCPNSTHTAVIDATSGGACPSTCPSDGEKPGTYITVGARISYTSVMPFSILGSSLALNAQSIVRVQ
jgi:TadE-like protein